MEGNIKGVLCWLKEVFFSVEWEASEKGRGDVGVLRGLRPVGNSLWSGDCALGTRCWNGRCVEGHVNVVNPSECSELGCVTAPSVLHHPGVY